MKRIMVVLAVLLFSGIAAAQEAEGVLGVDIGYSFGHYYTDNSFKNANGANLGFHYEPPLTDVLNLVVGAKYHFLYQSENVGGADAVQMLHIPQASVGVKFLMDVYTILPYMGGGVSLNLAVYDITEGGSRIDGVPAVRFAPGLYFDLGADIYVSDDMSIGFNARYDWTFDYLLDTVKVPNMLTVNMRINFMTIN